MSAPEFSRVERADTIGARERVVEIAADADERRALARRFGLVAVERLVASFGVRAEAGGVLATGRVQGAVVQACSATGEPLSAQVDEAVTLRFVDETGGGGGGDGDEVELSADALDTLPIEGGGIDLGEAAAETLALALDPFPRHPDADARLLAAGVTDAGAAGPFGALADLKRRLEE